MGYICFCTQEKTKQRARKIKTRTVERNPRGGQNAWRAYLPTGITKRKSIKTTVPQLWNKKKKAKWPPKSPPPPPLRPLQLQLPQLVKDGVACLHPSITISGNVTVVRITMTIPKQHVSYVTCQNQLVPHHW
jgi:hypothetical protein